MADQRPTDDRQKWLEAIRAIKRHDYSRISVMLEAGLDPSAALSIAASRGDTRMCEILLSAGADPNAVAALDHAATFGCRKAVRLLLDRGANPRGGNSGNGIIMAPVYGGADPRAAAHIMVMLQEAIAGQPDARDDRFQEWWEQLASCFTFGMGFDEKVVLGRPQLSAAKAEEAMLLRDGLMSIIVRRAGAWQLAARILEGHASGNDLAKIQRIAEAELIAPEHRNEPDVLVLLRLLAAQPSKRRGHLLLVQLLRDYPDAVAALRRCCADEPWWEAFSSTLRDEATNHWWRQEQRTAVVEALTGCVPQDT